MLAFIAIIIVFVVFIEVQYVLFKIYGFCIVSTDWGIGLFFFSLDVIVFLCYIVVVSYLRAFNVSQDICILYATLNELIFIFFLL